jgi:hypothetical protein
VRLLGDEGQPDALRVYHAAGFVFAPMPSERAETLSPLRPCTATISRAALGPLKLSAAWRAVIDQPPEAQGAVLGTAWEGWDGEEEPSR